VSLDELRSLTLARARERLGGAVIEDASYGPIGGLTMLHADDGSFYFEGERLVVARLSPGAEAATEAQRLVGADALRLRSSVAKRAWVLVSAPDGVAVTEEDGDVVFVEVFAPTTLENYRQRIYVVPEKFVE
jgi:hypothetical protein